MDFFHTQYPFANITATDLFSIHKQPFCPTRRRRTGRWVHQRHCLCNVTGDASAQWLDILDFGQNFTFPERKHPWAPMTRNIQSVDGHDRTIIRIIPHTHHLGITFAFDIDDYQKALSDDLQIESNGGIMARAITHRSGIEMLSQRYRNMFRIPENINHYSKDDFPIVERKFLKYALLVGAATSTIESQADTPTS